jgi:hypothetical protein
MGRLVRSLQHPVWTVSRYVTHLVRKHLPPRIKSTRAQEAQQAERRRVELEVYGLTGGKIAAGPFAGMDFCLRRIMGVIKSTIGWMLRIV